MTIKETEALVEQEKQGKLRKPNRMLLDDELGQREVYMLVWYINFLMNKNVAVKTHEQISKEDIELADDIKANNPYLIEISGSGTRKDMYKIKTTFGDGEFCDVTNFLKLSALQAFKQGDCFSNSYNLTMGYAYLDREAKQISGIAYMSKSYLHSVVYFEYKDKPYILDRNFNLVMNYDLYIKLFSFEILAETDGFQIANDINEIESAVGRFSFTASDYNLAFAYEETMSGIKKQFGIISGV